MWRFSISKYNSIYLYGPYPTTGIQQEDPLQTPVGATGELDSPQTKKRKLTNKSTSQSQKPEALAGEWRFEKGRTCLSDMSDPAFIPEMAVIPNNHYDWWFALGRMASKETGEKPVHLKNAIVGSFTRGENDSSWRNSSKAGCKTKVIQVKEGADYQLFMNGHSCAKCQLPEWRQGKPLQPIPPDIQLLLKMDKELFPPQHLKQLLNSQEEAENQKKSQTKQSRKRK
jgi:hypothetical protein